MKKRQRVGSNSRLSSLTNNHFEGTLPSAVVPPPAAIPGGFNDRSTADVVVRLIIDPETAQLPSSSLSTAQFDSPDEAAIGPQFMDFHLHSSVLCRSQYFAALLSGRWRHGRQQEAKDDRKEQTDEDEEDEGHDAGGIVRADSGGRGAFCRLNLKVPLSLRHPYGPFETHVSVLQLMYTLDFEAVVVTVVDALDFLHVALELLFEDCIRACIRFLEAVPWTEEEEEMVLRIVPFLPKDESHDLLARFSLPSGNGGTPPTVDAFASSSEEMLHGLVLSAINSHPTVATVKAFVARLLKDFSPKESVQRVLDRAFTENLETVKDFLAEYARPDFRVAGDNDETEAIQRLNLHAAFVCIRKLLWLMERMIEMRVADTAVREWSNQEAVAVDLQKAFRDETWRNIAPGLPAIVMRCTGRLAHAVAAGSILTPREIRTKLVRNWLPVLNVCRDLVSPIASSGSRYLELEETFLKIISTLPMSDSRGLLQDCLSFSTRNVDDCPHLISAFSTWFRRASRLPMREFRGTQNDGIVPLSENADL